MNNINITCPNCLTEFNGAEQLEQHFHQVELKDKMLNEKDNKIIQLEESRKTHNQEKEKLKEQLKNAKFHSVVIFANFICNNCFSESNSPNSFRF